MRNVKVASSANVQSALHIRFSSFCMQGERDYMEDRLLALGNVYESIESSIFTTKDRLPVSLFGVFDGHNGFYVASLLQETLPRLVASMLVSGDKSLKTCLYDACQQIEDQVLLADYKRIITGSLPLESLSVNPIDESLDSCHDEHRDLHRPREEFAGAVSVIALLYRSEGMSSLIHLFNNM